jgi:hypothetical protein
METFFVTKVSTLSFVNFLLSGLNYTICAQFCVTKTVLKTFV